MYPYGQHVMTVQVIPWHLFDIIFTESDKSCGHFQLIWLHGNYYIQFPLTSLSQYRVHEGVKKNPANNADNATVTSQLGEEHVEAEERRYPSSDKTYISEGSSSSLNGLNGNLFRFTYRVIESNSILPTCQMWV